MKQTEITRGGITRLVFHIMWITFRSVFPCLATGCHAFGFKIAASLRSSQ